MSDKLKSCPHCSGEAYCEQLIEIDSEEYWYQVGCTKCGIGILPRRYQTEQAAITARNTRVTGTQQTETHRKPLIYIAQPFGGKQENYIRAERTLSQMTETHPQYNFISPIIAYGFCYDVYSYDVGINQCLGLLSHCDMLWVCNDDGLSKGVKIERKWAQEHCITIKEDANEQI